MTERINVIERNLKQKHWKNMSIFVHIRYIIGANRNGRTLHERHVHNLNLTTYSAVCVCVTRCSERKGKASALWLQNSNTTIRRKKTEDFPILCTHQHLLTHKHSYTHAPTTAIRTLYFVKCWRMQMCYSHTKQKYRKQDKNIKITEEFGSIWDDQHLHNRHIPLGTDINSTFIPCWLETTLTQWDGREKKMAIKIENHFEYLYERRKLS